MILKKYILLVILLHIISHSLYAQIKHVSLLNESVTQFEKLEWELKLNAVWDNPYAYNDISLDMILTSPSGKEMVLPCYYESGESAGESVWKARFAARGNLFLPVCVEERTERGFNYSKC